MWIRTQNKQRIINSDHIVDIFIDKTGKIIYAETTLDDDFIELGEYENRDICMEIISTLQKALVTYDNLWIEMPFGGDADHWMSRTMDVVVIRRDNSPTTFKHTP